MNEISIFELFVHFEIIIVIEFESQLIRDNQKNFYLNHISYLYATFQEIIGNIQT